MVFFKKTETQSNKRQKISDDEVAVEAKVGKEEAEIDNFILIDVESDEEENDIESTAVRQTPINNENQDVSKISLTTALLGASSLNNVSRGHIISAKRDSNKRKHSAIGLINKNENSSSLLSSSITTITNAEENTNSLPTSTTLLNGTAVVTNDTKVDPLIETNYVSKIDELPMHNISKYCNNTLTRNHYAMVKKCFHSKYPPQTDCECWWDRHTFDTLPLGIPIEYVPSLYLQRCKRYTQDYIIRHELTPQDVEKIQESIRQQEITFQTLLTNIRSIYTTNETEDEIKRKSVEVTSASPIPSISLGQPIQLDMTDSNSDDGEHKHQDLMSCQNENKEQLRNVENDIEQKEGGDKSSEQRVVSDKSSEQRVVSDKSSERGPIVSLWAIERLLRQYTTNFFNADETVEDVLKIIQERFLAKRWNFKLERVLRHHLWRGYRQDELVIRDYYLGEGIFCSFECMMAYIDTNRHDPLFKKSGYYTRQLYSQMFGIPLMKVKIKKAPSWKILKIKGMGNVEIDEYRQSLRHVKAKECKNNNWVVRPIASYLYP
jgi:hypothetical protein